MNGLGSNTCIQDAFNLAWKVAYVEKGLAGRSLLDTYNTERQPVGVSIVSQANDSFRKHSAVWKSFGMMEQTVEERSNVFKLLLSPTGEGRKARESFRQAITATAHEFHGLGIEMNQLYSSSCIYVKDEPLPYCPSERAAEDDVAYYDPSTYPGRRLPHAWLNRAIPGKMVSTIDLAGHGAFTILTGPGGMLWKEAAKAVATARGCEIKVWSVGFRQDWEDVYFDWDRLRGVEESGAVLVRPDRFVAWRAREVPNDLDTCVEKLSEVMRAILGAGDT
ncbi:2,4-dichlorophenol 6-monooxygenase [Colletotrichum sp. SAR 10_86]|nr:2,4-dichlorophenol 6-monooxygenase [Colletotrichum sp. SAR 10_75]KAI8200820.1 2,4-dichlorophenol 6-monooxygenase [Colletotrichum sp. SAR 10_76]KAI8226815.1 2,4-dichlorophenol 6-monooxygenase [Colletotrichum sp. SAR 10_86]